MSVSASHPDPLPPHSDEGVKWKCILIIGMSWFTVSRFTLLPVGLLCHGGFFHHHMDVLLLPAGSLPSFLSTFQETCIVWGRGCSLTWATEWQDREQSQSWLAWPCSVSERCMHVIGSHWNVGANCCHIISRLYYVGS